MAEPTDLESSVVDYIDVLRVASERFPVERTGPRTPIPQFVRLLVLKRDKFRCDWCGVDYPGQLFNLDHIIPWSAGGSDHTSNLRILCPYCNEQRSNYRTDAAYSRRLGCTPMCQPCYDDGLAPDDFFPDEVGRVFCGTCNSISWVTTSGGESPRIY